MIKCDMTLCTLNCGGKAECFDKDVECNKKDELLNAYNQGRADKYQEITSEYMLLTEKQVEEIRADEKEKVINEVEKMLEELQVLAKLGSFELNRKELKYGIRYTVEDMTERLKELKENKW